MHRRQFVATSGAAAAVSLFPSAAFAHGEDGDAALNALFERIFLERVRASPEFASQLGLDKGANAALKAQLSPRTAAERVSDLARTQRALAALARVDTDHLSAASKLNRDVVMYQLESQSVAQKQFGIGGVQRPYRIFQQGGAYFSTPDFLNTAHTINTREDCDA